MWRATSMWRGLLNGSRGRARVKGRTRISPERALSPSPLLANRTRFMHDRTLSREPRPHAFHSRIACRKPLAPKIKAPDGLKKTARNPPRQPPPFRLFLPWIRDCSRDRNPLSLFLILARENREN